MPIICQEHKSPAKGNPLIIELIVDGRIVKIEIFCPVCGTVGWYLSKDETRVYCDKCGLHIGRPYKDIFDMKNIEWVIPGV